MAAPAHAPVQAPRSTGRVLPAWRAALLVVESLWIWYRRNWRATVFSSVLQPVLFLAAFGVGFGSLLGSGGRAAEATGGVEYLVYLAPALLAVGAIQTAAFESTYPVLSAFKWQRTYWGVTASPITPGQLAAGQLLWIVFRIMFSCLAFLAVAAVFGGVRGPGMLLGALFAVLCGVAFSAPLVAFAAAQENDGQQFNAVFRFVVVPMTLFSGTFFPISQLPAAVRPLAWISPLWHGTELSRGAALGTLDPLAALGHAGYLGALVAVGVLLTVWRFRLRLGR